MDRSEAEKLLQATKLRIAIAGHPGLVMPLLQAEIFGRVKANRVYGAADLARHLNKTLQSISGILHRMTREGWLDRHQEAQKTGGYEWIYTTKAPS